VSLPLDDVFDDPVRDLRQGPLQGLNLHSELSMTLLDPLLECRVAGLPLAFVSQADLMLECRSFPRLPKPGEKSPARVPEREKSEQAGLMQKFCRGSIAAEDHTIGLFDENVAIYDFRQWERVERKWGRGRGLCTRNLRMG